MKKYNTYKNLLTFSPIFITLASAYIQHQADPGRDGGLGTLFAIPTGIFFSIIIALIGTLAEAIRHKHDKLGLIFYLVPWSAVLITQVIAVINA